MNELQESNEVTELYSATELAGMFGIGARAMSDRLAKVNAPIHSRRPSTGGRPEAVYDKAVYDKLMEAAAAAAESQRQADLKAVSVLKDKQRDLVIHQQIENLRQDHSQDAVNSKIANALGFMQMLQEELVHQNRESVEKDGYIKELEGKLDETIDSNNQLRCDVKLIEGRLDKTIEEKREVEHQLESTIEEVKQKDEVIAAKSEQVGDLEAQLDLSVSFYTCESYAVRELGKSITIQHAAQITKNLHGEGRKEHGKTCATGSKYPACVWGVTDMEYAVDRGWFNTYTEKDLF